MHLAWIAWLCMFANDIVICIKMKTIPLLLLQKKQQKKKDFVRDQDKPEQRSSV